MDSSSDHSSSSSSSLGVELRLKRARNICVQTSRQVFVRCYLSTQSNKRVKIDSHEIPSSDSNPNFSWNQTFSLSCVGTEETLHSLKQGTIVFELRCRSSVPFLARISGSKLLARAEMPWNDVVGQPNMEIEKWVVMIPQKRCVYNDDDVKPPAIQIAMRLEEMKRGGGRRGCENCGCMDCGGKSCVDYDFFALEAALDAF